MTKMIGLIQTGAVALLAATAGLAHSNTDIAADRHRLSTLAGTYASTGAEPWGRGAFGTREFTFDHGRWSLRFVLALDPQMKQKVFEFRTQGVYYVGPESKGVPGAFDALFIEDAKFVTLRTRDANLVSAFGLAGCGLSPDVEKDVSVSGCAGWKPISLCREDHDLLAWQPQGGVQFGVRPEDNNMCTADRRPTALLPAVVRR